MNEVIFGTNLGRLSTVNRVKDGSSGWKGVIQVWDATTGREIASLTPPLHKGDTKGYRDQVTFSLDDRLLHTVSRDSTRPMGRKLLVATWEVSSGRHLGTVGSDDIDAPIAFSPNG